MISNKNLREIIIGKFSRHAFHNLKDAFTEENAKKSIKFADEVMELLNDQGILKNPKK